MVVLLYMCTSNRETSACEETSCVSVLLVSCGFPSSTPCGSLSDKLMDRLSYLLGCSDQPLIYLKLNVQSFPALEIFIEVTLVPRV